MKDILVYLRYVAEIIAQVNKHVLQETIANCQTPDYILNLLPKHHKIAIAG